MGRAYEIDPGFQTTHLAVFSTNAGQAGYSRAQTREFYRNVRERVSRMPGIASAAWSSNMPLWARAVNGLQVEGRVARSKNDTIRAVITTIDPAYFETSGIAIHAGGSFNDVFVGGPGNHGVDGGPGLAGKWKTKNVKISSPGVLEVALNGSDGLTLSFLDEKATCAARFDGKDYPATGPIWPPGWTCVVAKDSARSFDVTWKKDGKPMFKGKFSASADGKILTEDGSTPATTEKTKAVYDRQ